MAKRELDEEWRLTVQVTIALGIAEDLVNHLLRNRNLPELRRNTIEEAGEVRLVEQKDSYVLFRFERPEFYARVSIQGLATSEKASIFGYYWKPCRAESKTEHYIVDLCFTDLDHQYFNIEEEIDSFGRACAWKNIPIRC
jgi:hypothetical protein